MRRNSDKFKQELSVESFRLYFRVSQHFVVHKSMKVMTERFLSHYIVIFYVHKSQKRSVLLSF